MSSEWATRLMIVRGNFSKVSLAIYGELAIENPILATTYTPRPLQPIVSTPLSSAIDPANAHDPTGLARSLLNLIPDAPPFELVVRLMFCLKPPGEDWDLPGFPYLHPDLDEQTDDDFDLEAAVRLTTQPFADDAAYEVLQRFADRVADALGPKSSDQAYEIASILMHSAAQRPDMARLLMDRLDLRVIFDASVLDEDALEQLLVAASNPDIARYLTDLKFPELLQSMQHNASFPRGLQHAAQRLHERLQGWTALGDALWNTQAQFPVARAFLHTAGADEPSFGVLLHVLVAHSDVVTRLAENPVLADTPLVAEDEAGSTSQDEFIAFLRAWVGVASVLAVYAWADSVPNERCRERALGILSLWQDVKGYREIVNHLMLSRQMVFRLECMMDDAEPTRSGFHAERILLALSRVPASFLSGPFSGALLALHSGLSVIDEDERHELRSVAALANEGIPGALHELIQPLVPPLGARQVLKTRIALAVVVHELQEDEDGEWHTLKALWAERGHGLTIHLVDTLTAYVADVQAHFTLAVPQRTTQELLANLFYTTKELLSLLQRLVPLYPLPGRQLRALVTTVADLFACTDAADMLFTQEGAASSAAQRARHACIELARLLASPECASGEATLRTLLRHGLHAHGADPAHHALQVLSLIDHLLPMPRDAMVDDAPDADWVPAALPRVLADLTAFYRLLDPQNRVHLLRRLADLDEGVVGIGEWLVRDELKQLQAAVGVLGAGGSEALTTVRRYQVACAFLVLQDLLSSPSTSSMRLAEYVGSDTDAAAALTAASSALNMVALLANAAAAFKGIPVKHIDPGRIGGELSEVLLFLTVSREAITADQAEGVLSVLDWLLQQSHAGLPQLSTLPGISQDTLNTLCDRLADALPAERADALELLRATLSAPADDVPLLPSALLPTTLKLSLGTLNALLHPALETPSTPKRKTPPHAQNVLSMATTSPPTALLRSPAVTGLTKTYVSNDFRVLRQGPGGSARMNTSRLPSTHVDEFEMASVSPQLLTGGLPGLPPHPFGEGHGHGHGFAGLGAPFGGA
ncbi:hypothetical protein OF83DRAFT_874002 [Amylostereum chailletii]|nr:hypothetical protein OF83DRAFT_874002 [Amylostereum chailletii]